MFYWMSRKPVLLVAPLQVSQRLQNVESTILYTNAYRTRRVSYFSYYGIKISILSVQRIRPFLRRNRDSERVQICASSSRNLRSSPCRRVQVFRKIQSKIIKHFFRPFVRLFIVTTSFRGCPWYLGIFFLPISINRYRSQL